VNGIERRRTPVASKIAFPIAAGTAMLDGSPIPPPGMLGADVPRRLGPAAGRTPLREDHKPDPGGSQRLRRRPR
jgi:hypothetical protein